MCVTCGGLADSYCARCGLTPYCSTQCQRRDWHERHRAVCHNLARLAGKPSTVDQAMPDIEPVSSRVPPTAPLRRPRSPTAATKREMRRDDHSNDGTARKNGPATNINQNNNQDRARNMSNKGPRNFNNNNNNKQGDRRPPFRQANRNQAQTNEDDEEEEWGNKTAAASSPKPQPKQESPKPAPAQDSRPFPKQEQKPAPKQEPAPAPKEKGEPAPIMTNGLKGICSVSDVKPTKKKVPLVPEHYLVEMFATGDSILLSVDAKAADCRTTKPGFVCLSMHEKFKEEFDALCVDYVADCEADKTDYKPSPGDVFSYYNKEDGGWYRARCLSPALAALLDSSRVVALKTDDRLKRLPAKYETVPEFCCLLDANVKIGDNVQCTLTSKMGEEYKVFLVDVSTGEPAGEGVLARWLPDVQHPAPAPAAPIAPTAPTASPAPTAPTASAAPAAPATAQTQIPEVARPDVANNSRVLLVDATAIDRAFVRPADVAAQREFDCVLQDVVLYGRNAEPLKEPPTKGQTVIGLFSDGLHYRALVRRTNVKQDKYLLEYIEFGNVEISSLEKMYPCPPNLDLSSRPAQASLVTLQCKTNAPFTPAATHYLDTIKDGTVELLLTIPSGAKSAPSGSEVTLTVVSSNESVNKRLGELCTPDWKKLEEKGGDVVETKQLMYASLEYEELPAGGCWLDVTDLSALPDGVLSGCRRGARDITDLTRRMQEYCNSELGKKPYLPKEEELCIAKCPPYPQWFRAVVVDHTPGAAVARVCYIDYGNIEEVAVEHLRKMLPEFVRGEPALALTVEIMDFPKQPTERMLTLAMQHMQLDEEGRGSLLLQRCIKQQEPGCYLVEAPELIEAIKG